MTIDRQTREHELNHRTPIFLGSVLWVRVLLTLVLMISLGAIFGCRDSEKTVEPENTVVSKDHDQNGGVDTPKEVIPPLPPRFAEKRVKELQRKCLKAIRQVGAKADIAAMILDVDHDDILFDFHGNEAQVPASNMKLLLGAVAQDILGLDYQFRTRFAMDGSFENGVLSGNLIVVGCGDPTLSARFFRDDPKRPMRVLAAALAEQGLTRIEGRILADARAFSGPKTGPNWPKDAAWRTYMVEVQPLVYNDNQTTLTAANVGGETQVGANPDLGFVEVKNALSLTSKKNGHKIGVRRGKNNNKFVVSGRLWSKGRGYETAVNVHDGPRFFVHALKLALEDRGVVVEGGVGHVAADLDVAGMKDLMVYTSKLRRTLAPMIQNSMNLYAELVLRALGRHVHQKGSFAAGTQAVTDWLRERDLLSPNTVVADGSGLSRENRLSPWQIVRVLDHVAQDPQRCAEFRELLAQPEGNGTLRRRMKKLKGRVFAKTGTMSGISSLSGFVRLPDGHLLAFSILCNNVSVNRARKMQDALCTLVSELDS